MKKILYSFMMLFILAGCSHNEDEDIDISGAGLLVENIIYTYIVDENGADLLNPENPQAILPNSIKITTLNKEKKEVPVRFKLWYPQIPQEGKPKTRFSEELIGFEIECSYRSFLESQNVSTMIIDWGEKYGKDKLDIERNVSTSTFEDENGIHKWSRIYIDKIYVNGKLQYDSNNSINKYTDEQGVTMKNTNAILLFKK